MSAATLALSVEALIQRELPAARGGDRDAYGRIVVACQNTVTAIALAITRDIAASEDIAQDAFISAWQHLERLHSPDSFLPWLREIARNLARDHLRRHRDKPLDGPNAELALAVAADPGPQPMQRMIDDERETAAFELISTLPDDSRETLLLFYREGQSSQQVALLLGISDAAVRKRLSRARQLVRDDLLKRFGEFAQASAPSAALVAGVSAAIATLGKPSTAAAAVVGAGSAAAGSAVGKGLLGSLGMIDGGMVGAVGSTIGMYWYQRYLMRYLDTVEERRQVMRSFNRYMLTSLLFGLVVGVTVGLVPTRYFDLVAGAVIAVMVPFTLYLSVTFGRVMRPLLARDAERRPEGAWLRRLYYHLCLGPTAVVIANLIVVVAFWYVRSDLTGS